MFEAGQCVTGLGRSPFSHRQDIQMQESDPPIRRVPSGESREASQEEPWWVTLIFPMVGGTLKQASRPPSEEGFAPSDTTDDRSQGEWESRYPPSVHKLIAAEAAYLAIQCLVFLAIGVAAFMGSHDTCVNFAGYNHCARWVKVLSLPVLAVVGGGAGGTLFGLKWLYHSVAKGMWSIDRHLWRLFTPWISGVLALGFVALVHSGIIGILNPQITRTASGVFGVSFLVGYFSDITIGKLNEAAQVLFGRKAENSPSGKT